MREDDGGEEIGGGDIGMGGGFHGVL